MAGEGNYSEKYSIEESLLNPLIMKNSISQSHNIILIDSSHNTEGDNKQKLVREIKTAQTILLVYDMNDIQAVVTLAQEWLPLIKDHNPTIPVILVGNKLDLVIDNQPKYSRTEVRKNMTMLYK